MCIASQVETTTQPASLKPAPFGKRGSRLADGHLDVVSVMIVTVLLNLEAIKLHYGTSKSTHRELRVVVRSAGGVFITNQWRVRSRTTLRPEHGRRDESR
jgi:hypothetical protein